MSQDTKNTYPNAWDIPRVYHLLLVLVVVLPTTADCWYTRKSQWERRTNTDVLHDMQAVANSYRIPLSFPLRLFKKKNPLNCNICTLNTFPGLVLRSLSLGTLRIWCNCELAGSWAQDSGRRSGYLGRPVAHLQPTLQPHLLGGLDLRPWLSPCRYQIKYDYISIETIPF